MKQDGAKISQQHQLQETQIYRLLRAHSGLSVITFREFNGHLLDSDVDPGPLCFFKFTHGGFKLVQKPQIQCGFAPVSLRSQRFML